ncbi:hypothetical protein M405DRAFT_76952 [Rhizopogon salebrosus TDB-379]|nr:hypothetical protein M405DRAFT_76952 [Rhizopogon salebrosus TDB-379]
MSGNTPVEEGTAWLVQMRGLLLPCKASGGSRRLEIFFEAFNHAWSHKAEGMVQGRPGHYINASILEYNRVRKMTSDDEYK